MSWGFTWLHFLELLREPSRDSLPAFTELRLGWVETINEMILEWLEGLTDEKTEYVVFIAHSLFCFEIQGMMELMGAGE